MGKACGPISHAGAHRDDLHVGAVVADIVANLLQATQSGENPQAVCEDDFIFGQAPARGHPDHVLFSHPGVQEAVRKFLGEGLHHTKPQVAHDQANAVIFTGQMVEAADETLFHEPCNSFKAWENCSWLGDL